MHNDQEQLRLSKLVRVTEEVHEILRLERNRLRKEGRRVSMAKLTCNAVIKLYERKDIKS